MSSISDVLSASTAATTGTTATDTTSTASAADIENRFLTLLVTQMKNQDPLNPMDNAQITTQLAQISTVSGIDKLNSTMNSLSSSFIAGQSVQAANMIGHDVLVSGSNLTLAGGNASGAFQLATAADSVVVTVLGPAGNIVHQADLGPQAAGLSGFAWNGATDSGGTASDGKYSFQVQATKGGQSVSATALSVGNVNAVNLGTQGLTLSVDGVGDVKLTDVKQIL